MLQEKETADLMNTGTNINTIFIIKSRYIFLKCNTYHDQLGFITGSQQIITVDYQCKGKNNRCKNQAFGKIYHYLMLKIILRKLGIQINAFRLMKGINKNLTK